MGMSPSGFLGSYDRQLRGTGAGSGTTSGSTSRAEVGRHRWMWLFPGALVDCESRGVCSQDRTTVEPTTWARTCILKMTLLSLGLHQSFTVSCLDPIHPQRHLCLWMVAKFLLLSRDVIEGPPIPSCCWCHFDEQVTSIYFICYSSHKNRIFWPFTNLWMVYWLGHINVVSYAVWSQFQFYICPLLGCVS